MDDEIIGSVNEQIDELFDTSNTDMILGVIKPVGLGDLLAKRMREALETVIETALTPFIPLLNEYETIELDGDDE